MPFGRFICKLGLVISYIFSIGYFLSILMPALYCVEHTCTGPDLDGFMPAFFLIPSGGIATVFSLQNAIRQIKKKRPWSWIFWVLAVIFAALLAGTIGFIGLFIYMAESHR
jgi:hypothetical protein